MSETTITPTNAPPTQRKGGWRNLKIGTKLMIGFGIMVTISLALFVVVYFGSADATETINRTEQLRMPTALDSTKAQADLLRMVAGTRGYLALGDQQYREEYQAAQRDFAADLARLSARSNNLEPEAKQNLDQLQTLFSQWSAMPPELFDLRDDQLEREPALRILIEDATPVFSSLLTDLNNLIDTQVRLAKAGRGDTNDNISLIKDMAAFQSSLNQMISGLRGYVTTRRDSFKFEYETASRINDAAWERLQDNYDGLPQTQQALLDRIGKSRAAFFEYPPLMFEILEDEEGQYRTDLYRFRTEAVPLIDEMLVLLDSLTSSQQTILQSDLKEGRDGLLAGRTVTFFGGILAVVLATALAFTFRNNIAGPVVRLTGVASQIQAGDLEAQAKVESGDEIGVLAYTFNNMTTQLRGTLNQVRKEKRRADDLLEVVIPIGVDLTEEKDFNRLLEKILVEAKTFCNANAGALYLREGQILKPTIVRNDCLSMALGGTTEQVVTAQPVLIPPQTESGPHQTAVAATLSAKPLNINRLAESDQFLPPEIFPESPDFVPQSFLSIPLINSDGQILGVLELINAQDAATNEIIPFDENLEQMMLSFSSLAVAALEAYLREQSLKQEIQRLRIEIDEAKKETQVQKIVESDTFSDLQAKAEQFKRRSQKRSKKNEPSSDQ